MPGDLLHDRYRIVNKLGHGEYSTVWLARDTLLERYVALKIGIADSNSGSLRREIKSLRALSEALPSSSASSTRSALSRRGRNMIPRPLDEFDVHGPNGIHPCYAVAPARCNLRQASYSLLFPLDVARALCGGLALAVSYTHSCGFDHLSPEQLHERFGQPETFAIVQRDGNKLVPNIPPEATLPLNLEKSAEQFTLSDTQILLSDFGESFAPTTSIRLGEDCRTPLAFRAPEARFEPRAPLSFPSDIWSLATAMWEIIGMKAIFSTEYTDVDKVTAQQVNVLGPLPTHWWEQREENDGSSLWVMEHPGRIDTRGRRCMRRFEMGVQKYRRMDGMGVFDAEETAALLDLMRRMLALLPEERSTAEEVLASEWMVRWALPEFEKAVAVVEQDMQLPPSAGQSETVGGKGGMG